MLHYASAIDDLAVWPRGLKRGSLGAPGSPDERESDAHAWLLDRMAERASHPDRGEHYRSVRRSFRSEYSWAIPSKAALELLGETPVLEIGAGNGYWAFLLRGRGGTVEAIDLSPVEYGENIFWPGGRRSWTSVMKGTDADIARYPSSYTVLVIWPVNGFIWNVFETYKGKRVVYVGRADEQSLERLGKEWFVRRVTIPTFYKTGDSVWVFDRRLCVRLS